jgi:hypothetical protein
MDLEQDGEWPDSIPAEWRNVFVFSEHRNKQNGPQNANNILYYSYRSLFGGNTRKIFTS